MGNDTRKYIACDGNKLKSAVYRRGKTLKEMYVEVGYSDGYLKECGKRGSIHPSVVKLLKAMYGIDYEEIKPDLKGSGPATQETTSTKPVNQEPDYEKLYQVIYDAVYRAVKTAWMDE